MNGRPPPAYASREVVMTPEAKRTVWSRCEAVIKAALLIGAILAGVWIVLKPAIDGQYCTDARCDGMDVKRDEIKAHLTEHEFKQAESMGVIDKRLTGIETDLRWLVRRSGGK